MASFWGSLGVAADAGFALRHLRHEQRLAEQVTPALIETLLAAPAEASAVRALERAGTISGGPTSMLDSAMHTLLRSDHVFTGVSPTARAAIERSRAAARLADPIASHLRQWAYMDLFSKYRDVAKARELPAAAKQYGALIPEYQEGLRELRRATLGSVAWKVAAGLAIVAGVAYLVHRARSNDGDAPMAPGAPGELQQPRALATT